MDIARRKLLDHLLILGRRQLEQVLTEFVGHYNQARPHHGLGQRPPDGPADVVLITDVSPARSSHAYPTRPREQLHLALGDGPSASAANVAADLVRPTRTRRTSSRSGSCFQPVCRCPSPNR